MFAIAPRQDTILIVTGDTIARVDLLSSNSDQVIRASSVARHENADLGDGIRAAFALGPQKCDRVVILSDEFWTGQVSLANEIVTAIADGQLEQSLALEVEFESGLSAFDSRLGYARVDSSDEQTTWWVTQAASTQLDAAEAAVTKQAKNLIGFCSLILTPPNNEFAGQIYPLTTVESCISLAQQWHAQFSSDPNRVPLIRSLPKVLSETQEWQIGISLALVAFSLCLAWHIFDSQRWGNLIAEEARLSQQENQVKAKIERNENESRVKQEIQRKREAEQVIQTQRTNQLRRLQAEYKVVRRRPVQILKALATTAHSSHWIRRIDWQEKHIALSGIAMDHDAVLRFVEHIESELDSSCWSVQPAKISVNPSNDLVQFEATLIPIQRNQQLAATATGVADVRQ